MYRVDVDGQQALIDVVLDGTLRQEEMRKLGLELKSTIRKLAGRDIKVRADMRTLRAASPEVAEQLGDVLRFALRHGVKRMAELVHSPLVKLQQSRLARESGAEKILRQFGDDQTAQRWLFQPEGAALLA
jgi:hypothetical protein